jgi:enterochelin esterase family protein
MATRREEAAPTFPTWQQRLIEKERGLLLLSLLSLFSSTWQRRLEEKEQGLQQELERFLEMLRSVGTPMVEEPLVHFIYYGPEVRRVILAGEFKRWGWRGTRLIPLGRTGIFYRTLKFSGPARVEYKFIVDGQWIVDPLCPNIVDNGVGGQNSYFVVGDFRDPPELAWVPTIPHGRVEEFDFASELLHNRRRIYVYLPPGYDHDPTARFPTFYVHDGGEYLARARFTTVLDNLLHSQEISPLIAVMVDPVDRLREYWANEDYARFVEIELLPHIEGRYRTLAQREARGVMGASLGGLISTYLVLSRPHLFAKVGGQSSALFLEEERVTALAKDLETSLTFYFDVGQYEPRFIPAHRRLVPLLETKGCPGFFQQLPAGHNWTSWRAHLKDLLTFLWKEPFSLKTGMENTGSAGQ